MASRTAAAAGIPGAPPLIRRVLALAPLTALALAAACTGDEGGPVDRPFEATACTLLWYRARAQERFDLYKIEMPASAWTTGTQTFDGTTRIGVFYYGMADADDDGLFEQWQDAAAATGGDFSLVVEGLDEGDAITFTDSSDQTYYGVGDVPRAVGGSGSFGGVWSAPEVEDGEPPDYADSASVAMTYLGSSLTLGTGTVSAFGYCWADPLALTDAGWRAGADTP